MDSQASEQQYLAAEQHFNVDQLIAEMDAEEFCTYSLDIRDDVRISGSNPEMADFDNPRGYNYVRVYFLRASNDQGYTRAYGGFSSPEQAMNAFVSGIVPPVTEWEEDRPVYGSLAYQEMGIEEMDMMEERYA
jgi:hypothetical protein